MAIRENPGALAGATGAGKPIQAAADGTQTIALPPPASKPSRHRPLGDSATRSAFGLKRPSGAV